MKFQLLLKTKILKIKIFPMLNILRQCIYPAYKCQNANNCWNFNIYEQEKFYARLSWDVKVVSPWDLILSHLVYSPMFEALNVKLSTTETPQSEVTVIWTSTSLSLTGLKVILHHTSDASLSDKSFQLPE